MTPLNNKGHYALSVPSMAFGFDINNYGDESELMYTLDIEDIEASIKTDEALIVKKLNPSGNWSIIAIWPDQCNEEQAAQVVQKHPFYKIWYKNYLKKSNQPGSHRTTALESLSSLLKSLSIEGRCVILENQEPLK